MDKHTLIAKKGGEVEWTNGKHDGLKTDYSGYFPAIILMVGKCGQRTDLNKLKSHWINLIL